MDAGASEVSIVDMRVSGLRVENGKETRTQTIATLAKCGAVGAVAKVLCTVAGRLARTVCQLVIGGCL